MRALRVTMILAAAALALPAPAGAQNPWRAERILNIAHQGGEDEAPSNTMYAYARAMRLGTDMLELDVHSTVDGRVVVMHDAKVDRTTDGSGYVYDMTLAQVQRLDAAHDFVPGVGTSADQPPGSYPFRGVRTGHRPPPPGYQRRDFRIPTLEEVLRAYPQVPTNIEIKGRADTDSASFARNADLLAELLNRTGRTDGIIVASFNDAALDRFHAQAPQIHLAPATADVAAFKFSSTPLPEGMVALQVPITFGDLQVTDAEFVSRAHAFDYAVHVWLSNDTEDEATYNQLLDWDVDGIMAAQPGRLEQVLCQRGVERPEHGPGWPGGSHCTRHSSIACEVVVAGLRRAGGRLLAALERRDRFSGRCAGRVVLEQGGKTVGRARFTFGDDPAGEVRAREVRDGLQSGRVRATATPYEAFPRRTTVLFD